MKKTIKTTKQVAATKPELAVIDVTKPLYYQNDHIRGLRERRGTVEIKKGLYHFTAPSALLSVAKHGLWRGDVPSGPFRGNNAVNLTTLADPSALGEAVPVENRQIKMSVRVEEDDERLFSWSDYADEHRVSSAFRAAVERGGRADTWRFFKGIVAPADITVTAFVDDVWTNFDDWPNEVAALAPFPGFVDDPPPVSDPDKLWCLDMCTGNRVAAALLKGMTVSAVGQSNQPNTTAVLKRRR